MITARFTTDEKVLEFSGTVYNNEGRIIDFFGYKVDFKPEKYMLLIQNIDKPGMIGKIGTIVGEYGINIATMQVSRNKKVRKLLWYVRLMELCLMKQLKTQKCGWYPEGYNGKAVNFSIKTK